MSGLCNDISRDAVSKSTFSFILSSLMSLQPSQSSITKYTTSRGYINLQAYFISKLPFTKTVVSSYFDGSCIPH